MVDVVASRLNQSKFQEYEGLIGCTKYAVNLHPIWISVYTKAFGYEERQYMLEVRQRSSGVLCGLLPLVRKDSRESRFVTQRRLVPAGYGPTDFFDILALPGFEAQTAAGLAEWFKRNSRYWDCLTINLVPHVSMTMRLFLESLFAAGYQPNVISDKTYLVLDTSGPYDQYLRRLGTEKVKELRYYKNKLLKIGKRLEIEQVRSRGVDYFDDFVRVYTTRRTLKSQSDPYTRVAPLSRFIRDIIPEYEKHGWIRLSLLKLDQRVIAYCYHLIFRNVMYYYMPTFLDEFKQYSPGKLLLAELIKSAFEDEAIREFNFMRSEYSYKLWFCPSQESYVALDVSNSRSFRNQLLSAVALARKFRDTIDHPKAAKQ